MDIVVTVGDKTYTVEPSPEQLAAALVFAEAVARTVTPRKAQNVLAGVVRKQRKQIQEAVA